MMNVIQQTEYFYFRYFIYILMVKLLVLRLLLKKIIEQEQIYHHLLDEGHALKVLPVFFLLFITEKFRFPVGNILFEKENCVKLPQNIIQNSMVCYSRAGFRGKELSVSTV